jgi:hypothetical protein
MDHLNKIGEFIVQRNRMRESCSYGSVGERGGNGPLYPEDQRSDLKAERQIVQTALRSGIVRRRRTSNTTHVAEVRGEKSENRPMVIPAKRIWRLHNVPEGDR